MASSINIQVGPLSSSLNYANDTKVRETLLGFYETLNKPEGVIHSTNQERLDYIVKNVVALIIERARKRYIETERLVNEQEARTNYDFE